MKVAALTMVYRDHWFLKRWIKHYGRAFSKDNLFVVSHGNEADIRRIANGCNVIGIVRETSGDFDVQRWAFLNDLLSILLKQYDCVVVGDVDEYIVADPRFGTNLVEQLKTRGDAPVSFVTGVEMVETPDDLTMDDSLPMLSQRRRGRWNWKYTKASIVYDPVVVGRGAHFAWNTRYFNNEALLLFHMKFANLSIYDDILESRSDIREPGSDGKTRTPRGNGWTKETLDRVLHKMKNEPVVSFYDGLETFRKNTQTDPNEELRRVFPQRFFLNASFELPETFNEVL